MDKREYQEKLDEISRLIADEDYAQAARVADTIDWKRVRIKHSYRKNGRTRYYYTNPKVSQLKRGDIVLNCACHIQIHVGKGFDVGAHNNYDGRTGDSSGREVSVNYSWTGYNEVYRYYGKIGK